MLKLLNCQLGYFGFLNLYFSTRVGDIFVCMTIFCVYERHELNRQVHAFIFSCLIWNQECKDVIRQGDHVKTVHVTTSRQVNTLPLFMYMYIHVYLDGINICS